MLIRPYTSGWNHPTAKHHMYMLYNVLKHNKVVIHVPVEHAKSTWFSIVYPLWLLSLNKNLRIAIISDTLRQAKLFLSVIKWHLEENQEFKQIYPELVPDNDREWTKTEIVLKRDKKHISKDPTIVALGTGGAILGARLDLVIGDDICSLDNTYNEEIRLKTLKWWNEVIDSRVVENGRMILLGTLQHKQDLLCDLSERPAYKYVHLQAYFEDTQETLWKEQWSVKRVLDKRDSIGLLEWSKTLQNDRFSTVSSTLDVNKLILYGGSHPYQLPIMTDMDIYIGVDPAIADDKVTALKKKQDEFGLVVVGLSKIDKKFYLIEYLEEHLTFPEQVKIVEQYYLKYIEYRVKIGIESVAYQKALAQQTRILKSMPPVIPVKVGTHSKATRISTFSVYAETGQILVHYSHSKFLEQWRDYEPGGKSPNLIDAFVTVSIMVKGGIKDNKEKEAINKIRNLSLI